MYDKKNEFLSRTATNLIEANALSVRDYKTNIYEIHKKEIEQLHAKMMANKPVYREQGITDLQKFLSPKFRELFLS